MIYQEKRMAELFQFEASTVPMIYQEKRMAELFQFKASTVPMIRTCIRDQQRQTSVMLSIERSA